MVGQHAQPFSSHRDLQRERNFLEDSISASYCCICSIGCSELVAFSCLLFGQKDDADFPISTSQSNSCEPQGRGSAKMCQADLQEIYGNLQTHRHHVIPPLFTTM